MSAVSILGIMPSPHLVVSALKPQPIYENQQLVAGELCHAILFWCVLRLRDGEGEVEPVAEKNSRHTKGTQVPPNNLVLKVNRVSGSQK